MNSKQTLWLAAAQLAAAVSQPFEGIPHMPKTAAPAPSENRKKCKSCRHIGRNANGGYACQFYAHICPQDTACGRYEKRKRR